MIVGDKASAMVTVPVPPAEAFEIFTQETELWWRRGVAYRVAGRHFGTIAFEPFAGGRLFEQYEHGGTRVHEVGKILIWDPPTTLEFEWRGGNFAPGEVTTVSVTFAPSPSGTRVTVEHRGLASLRPDHPARHGEEVPAYIRMMGMWWGDLLTGLRVHSVGRPE